MRRYKMGRERSAVDQRDRPIRTARGSGANQNVKASDHLFGKMVSSVVPRGANDSEEGK